MDEISKAPLSDEQAMELALQLASFGAGFVSPNPQVGCVILDSNGFVISSGYHKKFGGPHAEVDALASLSPREMNQARMFVTLEPCAHEGKTPSCAKAIAKLPIKEVIFGIVDPNPLVSGKGADILRAAGIKVTEYQGRLKKDLKEICEHFLVNVTEKRPFVSVKVAASIDGQLSLKSGESKWITGEEARLHAHYLRATHDAVLIGQGTLEKDNPSLDVRHPEFPEKRNKVLILLSSKYEHLNILKMNVAKSHSPEEMYFFEKNGALLHALEMKKDGSLKRLENRPTCDLTKFNVNNLLSCHQDLDQSIKSILVEGGAKVISSFITANEVDRLYLFQAPILLGAKGGKSWTEEVIIPSISSGILLRNPKLKSFDRDWLITGRLK